MKDFRLAFSDLVIRAALLHPVHPCLYLTEECCVFLPITFQFSPFSLQVKCFHTSSRTERDDIFRVQFHTGAVQAYSLVFQKHDMEHANKGQRWPVWPLLMHWPIEEHWVYLEWKCCCVDIVMFQFQMPDFQIMGKWSWCSLMGQKEFQVGFSVLLSGNTEVSSRFMSCLAVLFTHEGRRRSCYPSVWCSLRFRALAERPRCDRRLHEHRFTL